MKLNAVFGKDIDQRLTPYLILRIAFYAVNVDDLLGIVMLYEMESQILYAFIILGLDAGQSGDIDLERDHGDACSLEPRADTLLLVRIIERVCKHDRTVKIFRIGKVEDIELALILEFVGVGGAVRYKYKNVCAVFLGLVMKTRNYIFNEFATEAVVEYSQTILHPILPGLTVTMYSVTYFTPKS